MSKSSTLSSSLLSDSAEGSYDYQSYIRACFHRSPSAKPYYQQLLNYLAKSNFSAVQNIQYYNLQSSSLDHVPFWAEGSEPSSECPQVVVLEGLPSPKCVNILGAQYNIRPELFIGHLDFPSNSETSGFKFFELPTLPSQRAMVSHVRLISLGRHTSTPYQSHRREQATKECQQWRRQQFSSNQYGSTTFREVYIHNAEYFSVEQLVSFTTIRQSDSRWSAIFLLDHGRDLRWTHHLPWSTSYGVSSNAPQFVPQLPYNNPTQFSFGGIPGGAPTATATSNPVVLHSYHPLQDIFATSQEELDFLVADPFLLLSRLLIVAATSWLIFLNFLERDIEMCSSSAPEQRDTTLEQLRFNSALLHRVANFSRENQQVIKEQRGGALSSNLVLAQKIDRVAASLKEDYEYIVTRCNQLVSRCESSASILVNAAQLVEAQKGIHEARQVQNLTRLAFVFVPLSYVATLFSMQVSAFETYQPVWTYFAIAIPLTILCWLISGSLGERLRCLWLNGPRFIVEFHQRRYFRQ